MTNKILISVIIPTYNGYKLLKLCLEAIRIQKTKPHETIIVDNSSTDNTIENVINYFPEVKIIKLNKNYGFSKACNEGIKAANGNYVAILNNDVIINKDWIDKCVKTINRNSDISCFTSKIIKKDHPTIIESVGDYIDSSLLFKHRGEGILDKKGYNIEENVLLIPATAALYKTDFFLNVGFFDEKFISYFEDVDLSLRGQIQGHKYLFVPTLKATHLGKATSNKYLYNRGYLELRNYLLVWIKNLPTEIIKNKKIINKIFINVLTILVKNFSFKKLFQIIKIFIFILFNFNILIKERRMIQSKKVISIKYFYDNILSYKVNSQI